MKHVYFARVVGTHGPIKIGCSSCPTSRCKQLGFDLATQIEVVAEVPGDLWFERNLHIKFAEHKAQAPQRDGRAVAGATEWFNASPPILKLIEEAKATGEISLRIDECRERAIAARYKAGETLQQIAADYSITRERVRQILHALKVPRRSAVERSYIQSLARTKRFREWAERRRAAE